MFTGSFVGAEGCPPYLSMIGLRFEPRGAIICDDDIEITYLSHKPHECPRKQPPFPEVAARYIHFAVSVAFLEGPEHFIAEMESNPFVVFFEDCPAIKSWHRSS